MAMKLFLSEGGAELAWNMDMSLELLSKAK
jgi:hypothetical protein